MGMPGGQRRILVKTEDAIRAADPGLASLLDTFGSLNRDEEMPQTEQLPAGGRLHLGRLPGTAAARRESGARPFTRYAAIVLYALVVAFWVSWIVTASAYAHSASCPSGKVVTASLPSTTIATCKLSGTPRRRPAHPRHGVMPGECLRAGWRLPASLRPARARRSARRHEP
jgi:hypothetical protein